MRRTPRIERRLNDEQNLQNLRPPTDGHRVLFLEAENWRQIPIRFQKLCLGYDVDPQEVLKQVLFEHSAPRTVAVTRTSGSPATAGQRGMVMSDDRLEETREIEMMSLIAALGVEPMRKQHFVYVAVTSTRSAPSTIDHSLI